MAENPGFGGATAGLRIRRAVAEAQVANRQEAEDARDAAIQRRLQQTRIENTRQSMRQRREEAERQRKLREREEQAFQAFAESEKQRQLEAGQSVEEAERLAEQQALFLRQGIESPEVRELGVRNKELGVQAQEEGIESSNLRQSGQRLDLKTRKAAIGAAEFLSGPEGVALRNMVATQPRLSKQTIERVVPADLDPLTRSKVVESLSQGLAETQENVPVQTTVSEMADTLIQELGVTAALARVRQQMEALPEDSPRRDRAEKLLARLEAQAGS